MFSLQAISHLAERLDRPTPPVRHPASTNPAALTFPTAMAHLLTSALDQGSLTEVRDHEVPVAGSTAMPHVNDPAASPGYRPPDRT